MKFSCKKKVKHCVKNPYRVKSKADPRATDSHTPNVCDRLRAAFQKLEKGEINKTKVLKVLCPKCLETQINSASEGLE